MECIFCHKDSSSKSIEHIIPESLGNKHHVLPAGYVCDACNNYFAVKIEKELLAQPYFVSMRFRNEILTKKNRHIKQKMIFPEVARSTDVILSNTEEGIIASFDDEELFELIRQGKTKKMIELFVPEPEYPNPIMSRFLAKCAYEYFLYNVGADNYEQCVEDLLGSKGDVMKGLREYARYGKGKHWEYCQKRVYPENCLFVDKENGKLYETLHEMKLYTKEYNRNPNGDVEAEIYFVLAIMGIEYVICISDPNMTDYMKEWQENGKSHLINDDEQILIRKR